MYGVIDKIDFGELDNMKYFAPPSSWPDSKKKETARSRIFSGEWLGSRKNDGFFSKLIKDEDGTIILYGRSRGVNGQYANKHEWVPQLQPLFDALPVGTCLLGELYLPDKPGSRYITSVMGCLQDKAIARQKSDADKIHFYAFDVLAWNNKSLLKERAANRFDLLKEQAAILSTLYSSYAVYYTGAALWAQLQEILATGGEGMVITHQDALYEPGKRPSKTTLKIKQELKQTIDCFFTGRATPPTREYTGKEIEEWPYWMNTMTGEKIEGEHYKEYARGAAIMPVTKGYFYGWAGSLEIGVLRHHEGSKCIIHGVEYLDTEVYPIGYLSGLTEDMKADVYSCAFRPIEVTAMSLDTVAVSLRHGKMIGWRDDLSIADCTYEKLMGMA